MCVCVCVRARACMRTCVCVKSHLTYGVSVHPENAVTYSAGNEGHMRWHRMQDIQYLHRGFCISVLFIKFCFEKYIHKT